MNPYSIRLVTLDSYMSSPVPGLDVTYSEFRGSAVQQVPILRIFGSTEIGKKICLHIHGVFPYFYIPYDGVEQVNSLMYQIATNIDKAINISLNQTSSNVQHVYKITLVSGIPMYGFHSKNHQFFKVYLYNPMLIRRVSNLLMNESTLGKLYQPHEVHVPFVLQFMIDYNLHGMSNLILSEMKFRTNLNNLNDDISPELLLPTEVKKISSCEIEGDAFAEHILNRLEIASGNIGVNPGIAALWADEKQRRRNKGEISQIEHLLELTNINIEPTKSHLIFKQALCDRIVITSTEKNIVIEKSNQSIYPAETPENLNIRNASLCDSQGPSSLELSLNDTLTSESLNDITITEQSDILSETLDEEAQNLFNILKNLEANTKGNEEEDSILSQVIPDNEDEKDFDLSMPLEAITTPEKIIPNKDDSSDDDLLSKTIVPQLDGQCDEEKEDYGHQLIINNACNGRSMRSFTKLLNERSLTKEQMKEQKLIKKALYVELIRQDQYVKKGRSMPLLDVDFDITPINSNIPSCNSITNCDKSENKNGLKEISEEIKISPPAIIIQKNKSETVTKKRTYTPEEYMLRKSVKEMKSWEFQVKRTKRRYQLLRLMKKIHEKENRICLFLSKNCKPIFNVIAGVRRKARRPVTIDIISEILLNTRNHVDPDLHFILQYPTKKSFLYYYNGNNYPEISKIPVRLLKPGSETKLKNFIIEKSAASNDHTISQQDKEQCKKPPILPKKDSQTISANCRTAVSQKNVNFSSHIAKIKENNSTLKINMQKKQVPLQEIIDSENKNQCYIFSSKYLTNICQNNTIHGIENQSIDHLKNTLEQIKKELGQHILQLKDPVCNKRNISTKNENVSVGNNSNTIDCVVKKCKEQKEKTQNFHKDVYFEDTFTHKEVKGKTIYNDNITNTGNKMNSCVHLQSDVVINLTKLPQISCITDTSTTSKQNDFRMKRISINIKPLKVEATNNNKILLKKCLFLDGTKDSSSSEDESSSSSSRQKRTSRKQSAANFLRYSALPITVHSSPGCQKQENPSNKHPVSQSTIENCEEKKTAISKPEIQPTVCDIKVKRRLNFINTSFQTTFVEENLVCNYSPSYKQGNQRCVLNFTENTQPQKSNELSQSTKKIGIPLSVNDDLDNDNISQIATDHSDSSRCDLFSPTDKDDINLSFFKSPEIAKKLNLQLTIAEKYDKDANFHAKEGTSKVFTPQSSSGSQKSSEDIHLSSRSSSFDLLTPYQREKSTQPNNFFVNVIQDENLHTSITTDVLDTTDSEITSYKTFTPHKKAPSKSEVINSLDIYKIPTIKSKVPFYSNVEDVTGSVEVGYNVLKIISKGTTHLMEFDSQTDGINNFRKLKLQTVSSNVEWKKSKPNNLLLSFCQDRDCILIPIKKPPSVEEVKSWIREKSKKNIIPEKKTEKIKIFIPLSPNNNGDDEDNDLNISLTLSPCTPISSKSDKSISLKSSQTPKSSKDDSSLSRKTIKKTNDSSVPSLRKSLFLSQDKANSSNSGQITGVSLNNTYGFDNSTENLQAARALIEHQHLTLLVVELHIRTRGEFKPNPEYDPICAIFYSIFNDVPATHPKASKCKGVIAINAVPFCAKDCNVPILDGAGVDCNIIYVDTEENLFKEFLKLVKYWDPDIFAGYEIQMLSWGYLIDRASILGINYKNLLSRISEDKKYIKEEGQNELQITGRIILDVWRLMRYEVALQSYTFESIVYHILHKRVPQYPFKDLSFWWDHRSTLYRYRTAQYYLFRVETILDLLDKLDLIGRTSELARLFGIQFFEVLSRGSQFRVESMMLRLAKPLNFIPVSPSVQQRANMKAPEYIPLVLEPESKMYNDPVIVLDFQSLYPSIIIAYNYCFTTCLGRVECLGKNAAFEFGATQLKVSRRYLERLLKKDLINFSPCGACFVKKEVRDGILPRMLREILDTRLMVKNSMKENKGDQLLQKVLHNRQLGLKLIANVTYGYTAANFSGRMPSVEVADSVVSKGKETLQRAIEMVDSTAEWGARVVYGDTDSLFVLVPGKSRQHAFEIGKKIADAVTKANPDPIKLKLEKVYQPCILQTKKRYVGYMYEGPDQKDPVYDAKGIETVRRDGCPAVSKMLEKCLRLIFETKDVSLVKKYVLRQFNKVIAGRTSIQDLTFAKEYRGASGYRPGACVPSLQLARKWTAVDKRNEPRRGERVPYIIINGPPGLPLIRLVRSPRDLLCDPSLRPNALYYITKVIIPPINRCFNLLGADVTTWFNQMPRKQIQALPSSVSPGKKSTISQYFSTTSCVSCGEQTQTGICGLCVSKPQTTSITLTEKLRLWERNNYNCNLICQSCTNSQSDIKCVSLDCPVLYRRIQSNRDVQQTTYIRELIASNEF